jgi:hypothetical protein
MGIVVMFEKRKRKRKKKEKKKKEKKKGIQLYCGKTTLASGSPGQYPVFTK